jgi:hypothetical protein
MVGVVSLNDKVIDLALNSAFNDFEDGIQFFAAREQGIKLLLTRNVKDYKAADLIIQTPEEYLKTVKAI